MTNTVGPYLLGKTLGAGSTGKVKLGIHQETHKEYAIKIISKKQMRQKPEMLKKIEQEIAILKLLKHPHILKLYNVYETSNHLYLVMEYLEGGELFDYLVKRGTLPEEEALFFFQQIIFGLAYCHNHLICHRDLKPENLLLDTNNYIKIADFGMASLMKDSLLGTSCGSPHYAAPEVIKGIQYNGMISDIWSCGIILFALLAGRLPFDDPNIQKLLRKVTNGVYSMPRSFTTEQANLVSRMIVVDPKKRITMEEIQTHSWFTSNFPKIYKIPNPSILSNQMQLPVKIDNLDEKILSHLRSLGFTNHSQLINSLTRPEKNLAKVFYWLFFKKLYPKQHVKKLPDLQTFQDQEMELDNSNDFFSNDFNESKKNYDEKNYENLIQRNESFDEDILFEELEDPNKDALDFGFKDVDFDSDSMSILNQEGPTDAKSIRNQEAKKNGNDQKSDPIWMSKENTNSQNIFHFGSPRFHRNKYENEVSQSFSINSQSPKQSWFGSWFRKMKNSEQNKTEKITSKKVEEIPKIVEIKKQSLFFHLLAQIQQILDKLGLLWKHTHEFHFQITDLELRLKIEIIEDSSQINRNIPLTHRVSIIWKEGDLFQFELLCDQIRKELQK
ncbi:serine/threonine-protein kinase brsk2-like protein [Anaeramoeba ignava]|uniref:Serine/threonine-protein kinase brsk2-like protein n=1 Tax=Anaeramoeba ignava TaxID=1746090 RepID=A0A9Q0R8U6_ANAIG|nr:serine/threonine-protein kinase brsk2-like protein [Anaeramoeba ignava]